VSTARHRTCTWSAIVLLTVALGTLAGCGDDDTPAARFAALADAAALGEPSGIGLDAAGNVYFADEAQARIGRIDAATGALTIIAGGTGGFCGDGGPAITACFQDVTDVAVDREGNIYVLDRGDEDLGPGELPGRIRRIDAATGIIATLAGNCTDRASPRALAACLTHPTELMFEPSGALLVGTEVGVRRIDVATGGITDVAGSESLDPHCGDDDIPATEACLSANDLALDAVGNLYVLGGGAQPVRRIDAGTGRLTHVVVQCSPDVDPANGHIRKVIPAPLLFPVDLEWDARGRLLVSDLGPAGIQRVTLR
jgi:sugar lactone lactonase YvrE